MTQNPPSTTTERRDIVEQPREQQPDAVSISELLDMTKNESRRLRKDRDGSVKRMFKLAQAVEISPEDMAALNAEFDKEQEKMEEVVADAEQQVRVILETAGVKGAEGLLGVKDTIADELASTDVEDQALASTLPSQAQADFVRADTLGAEYAETATADAAETMGIELAETAAPDGYTGEMARAETLDAEQVDTDVDPISAETAVDPESPRAKSKEVKRPKSRRSKSGRRFAETVRLTEKEVEQLRRDEKLDEAKLETFRSLTRELSDRIISELQEQVDQARADGDGDKLIELLDRIGVEEHKQREEAEMLRDVTLSIALDPGLNGSKLVRFEDSEFAGVYKPVKGETNFVVDHDGNRIRTREGIDAGSFFKREWVASQIDRVFELHVVPTTIVREGEDGIGSVQKFEEGLAGTAVGNIDQILDSDAGRNLAIFDIITGNSDRHLNNLLIDKHGQAIGIDNGLILSNSDGPRDRLRSYAVDVNAAKQIPDATRAKLEGFLESKARQDLLERTLTEAFGHEEASAHKQKIMNRVRTLLAADDPLNEPNRTKFQTITERKAEMAARQQQAAA